MLGPPAGSVVIAYGERHSHALGFKRLLSLVLVVSVTGNISVYGERHSHALGSKRPFLLSDCRQVTGSGIRKPGPQAPLFPYLSSPYMLYPKLNKYSTYGA